MYSYMYHINEELRNLYSSPRIIRMTKSKRVKWIQHVARMEKRNAYRTLVGKPQRKRPLGWPGRRWVENIKMDLREIGWDGMVWIGLIWLRIKTVEGSWEHGNESSGSIQCWKVIEQLHNWRLLKKGSDPWVSDIPYFYKKRCYIWNNESPIMAS
jgi:hypothetical protein